MSAGLSYHPFAEVFPLMDGSDYQAFVEDIREHGVLEPVTLFEGAILDGRNRYRAAQEIGIKCPTTEYSGDNPLSAVVSRNLHRRQLTPKQRAIAAAKMLTLRDGQRADLTKKRQGIDASIPSGAVITVEKAAKMMDVDHSNISYARFILDKGTPEQVKDFEENEVGVRTTYKLIRDSKSPEELKARRKEVQSDVVSRQRIETAVYHQLRQTLEGFKGLPLPADVAAMIRRTNRTGAIEPLLPNAASWLKEFEDAWHSNAH